MNSNSGPSILIKEIESIIKVMKKGKAAGPGQT